MSESRAGGKVSVASGSPPPISRRKARTVNRKRRFTLCPVLAAIILITPSHNLGAVEVCSPASIGGQAAAEAYCGGCCEKGCKFKCEDLAQQMGVTLPATIPSACGTRENWNGNWLMDSETLKCGGANEKNSVCGCTVYPTCQCDNGQQRACLEPEKCWDDCGCSQGNACNEQWKCVKAGDPACCNRCRSASTNCTAGCVLVPAPQRPICNNECLVAWQKCAGSCGGWCGY